MVLTSCRPSPPQLGGSPPKVEIARPLLTTVPLFFEVIGQTEATANVDVRARVEGFVQRVVFEPGSFVDHGDLLYELDPEPIEQRLLRAKAGLADAEASLEKALLDIARFEPLVEQRAIPRQDLDNARATEKRAAAAVAAARADLRSAELDLSYAKVTAPIAGLIGDKMVDTGDLVGRGEPTLLATISPLDPIWVNASVSEVQYLEAQKRGRDSRNPPPVFLVLADGSIHGHAGNITFVDRTIESTTGSLRLRAEFPNPDRLLRPGQFVRLRVLLADLPNVLLLPQRAVQEVQGQRNVWVVNENNKVSFRRITTGPRIEGLWVVTSGLEPNERVVTEGLLKVRNDIEVDPSVVELSGEPVIEYRRKNLPAEK